MEYVDVVPVGIVEGRHMFGVVCLCTYAEPLVVLGTAVFFFPYHYVLLVHEVQFFHVVAPANLLVIPRVPGRFVI